mgnify:FL=1|tara:strand:- start:1411 stop:1617 length:207 start_codon:yes stop_codon:yes gene_type:complete
MATKGQAARSATGAAMSKYDVEVESRLQALEAKAHSKCDGGGDSERVAALEAKVDELIAKLRRKIDLG